MNSFSYLEPVCCSTSSSNCCFLTCIQISQEADQVVWYSHLFQNFPQFIVIHTLKGFGIVNKAEIDVFLELSCFFDDPADVRTLLKPCQVCFKASQPIWRPWCLEDSSRDMLLHQESAGDRLRLTFPPWLFQHQDLSKDSFVSLVPFNLDVD